MAIKKSVEDWINDLLDKDWTNHISVMQAQLCTYRIGTSNKHYTLMILYNGLDNNWMFCKMYGPIGKWTGWENKVFLSRSSAEDEFDTALAKRRERGYTDQVIYNLEHATVCLRGLIAVGVQARSQARVLDFQCYQILRNFATYGELSKTEMKELNLNFKYHRELQS